MVDKRQYTNLSEIKIDLSMYAIFRQGGIYNLGLLQPVAEARWQWFVDNWTEFRERFLANANGDADQLSKLDSLNNEIVSFRLGNNNNPFGIQIKFFEFQVFLKQITLAEMQLTAEESVLRDKEIERISQLDISDFRRMCSLIRLTAALESQKIGLGDPDAARLIGINVQPKQRNATVADLENLAEADKMFKLIEGIIFDLQRTEAKPPNLLTTANRNITPDSPVAVDSGFLSFKPVPFEISLEHMAEKFMGSKLFWFELATVNNLQPPFIDEQGSKLNLLAPSAVNNLIISDSQKANIHVGTKIGVGSFRFREESRIVEKIIVNENQTMVLFLSGTQDLNKFSSTQGAFVRIFKPHTTRRNSFILVPQRNEAAAGNTGKKTPSSDELRRLEKALLDFGVDIARDEKTRDFVISANGNFKFSTGLSNITKTILNRLRTREGELPFHPTYGVNINIGSDFFGTVDEAAIFGTLIRDTLLADPRFENILIQSLSATGTGIALTLLVTIEGATKSFPLSFVS